jgi:hypothetical protein
MNKKTSMLYIMSPSYSGSTLLTFLLADNPTIATIGELKASALGDIESYLCSCGEKLIKCDFWGDVKSRMRARGNRFSLERFGTHFRSESTLIDRVLRATVHDDFWELIRKQAINYLPGCRKELNHILHQNKEIIDIILEIQEADVYLDGSKDPNRLKYFYESGFWDIRVIFLVRDGRGVTNSYMKHVGASMEMAAREWCNKCEEMYRMSRIIPEDKIYFLKYEELCQSTNEVLQSILEFTGVDPSECAGRNIDREQHILGNAMRLRTNTQIKLDEKWRSMLSKNDLTIFESIAGKMNAKLGYV